MHDAVERVLAAHAPYPALVVDHAWDLVSANDPVYALLTGVPGWLLEPPVNVVRLTLHPDGLAGRIANLAQWRAHLLHRLTRELELSNDDRLQRLLGEVAGYPGGGGPAHDLSALVVPLRLRTTDGTELSLFSTTTVFGTAREVTVSEPTIEAFYPVDARTRGILGGV